MWTAPNTGKALWKCEPLSQKEQREKRLNWVCDKRSPTAENDAQYMFFWPGDITTRSERQHNHPSCSRWTSNRASFQSYLKWMLTASFCYQQHERKFPPPYDIFSCCDSRLKSMIFVNSPVRPGGLRASRKQNGTVEATTMSAGSPSTRLLKWIGLSQHKATSSFPNAPVFHMIWSSRLKIKYRVFFFF